MKRRRLHHWQATAFRIRRRFPGEAGQGWGGAAVFASGITGAAGAFLWGMLADRRGPTRVLLGLQLAAIPFVWLLLATPRIELAPVASSNASRARASVSALSSAT